MEFFISLCCVLFLSASDKGQGSGCGMDTHLQKVTRPCQALLPGPAGKHCVPQVRVAVGPGGEGRTGPAMC